MKHYVYAHYRKDTNEPFYIGKGSGTRYSKVHGRNQYWKRIVTKYGYCIKILEWYRTHEEALSAEIDYIRQYEAAGYRLTNMTKGGEGIMGYKFSEAEREHQSQLGTIKMSEPAFAERVWEGHKKWKQDPENLKVISGRNGNAYKGDIEATNIKTQKKVILVGAKELRKYGFDHTRVYDCVNGKRNTHKGYTFKRLERESI